MSEIVVVENISLDGVMQGPASAEEDPRGGFTAGGWATRILEGDRIAAEEPMRGGGAPAGMLFGRRTYDQLVGHWLSTKEPNPFTEVIRNASKYVVSRSADTRLPHPNSQLITGDVPAAIAELRASLDGDLVVLGSGELVRTLLAHGLVDRMVLTIVPVVLGSGLRLFGDTPVELAVEDTVPTTNGAVVGRYRVVHGPLAE